MVIRKSNLDILETPDEKLQSSEERWQKSFIEGELCQNEPIPVDQNGIAYTMIQHGCYDDEQKLLETLVAKWDSLSVRKGSSSLYKWNITNTRKPRRAAF
jgi:hypothetical protein